MHTEITGQKKTNTPLTNNFQSTPKYKTNLMTMELNVIWDLFSFFHLVDNVQNKYEV